MSEVLVSSIGEVFHICSAYPRKSARSRSLSVMMRFFFQGTKRPRSIKSLAVEFPVCAYTIGAIKKTNKNHQRSSVLYFHNVLLFCDKQCLNIFYGNINIFLKIALMHFGLIFADCFFRFCCINLFLKFTANIA